MTQFEVAEQFYLLREIAKSEEEPENSPKNTTVAETFEEIVEDVKKKLESGSKTKDIQSDIL